MVRAVVDAWAALGAHPQGRWVRLVLEVVWYAGLAWLVWSAWHVPAWTFQYARI